MTMTFLHTAQVHVATFNTLLAELAPDIPVQHLVDESLLQEARETGGVTPALHEKVERALLNAADDGASVVVCTCSSIGAVAEFVDQQSSTKIMRVDRAMAEEAVALGTRLIVTATVSSTLQPTRELLLSAARDAGKEVEVIDLLCDSAWQHFLNGDQAAYLQEIALRLREAGTQGDVIVLAQASMTRALDLCPDLPIPVLSSPRSGTLAAIQAYRGTSKNI